MANGLNGTTKTKNLVSISQAAAILEVSIDTIRRWDKAGIIQSTRPDGKNRYFSADELEKLKLEQPLSISEAAQMIKVSASTLRRLEKRGLISPIRNRHGERRYSRKTLEGILESDYFMRQKEVEEEVLEPLKPAPTVEESEPQINQPGVEFAIKRLISEHHINIRQLRERFGVALGISAAVLVPLIVLVGILTTAFLVNPGSTAKKLSLNYSSIPNATNAPSASIMVKAASTDSTQDPAEPVSSNKIYAPNAGWKDNLRPLVNIALFLVKQVDNQKYATATADLKISDVNSIFQPNKEGGIRPVYTLSLASDKLSIGDRGLILNLNSDLLQGKTPGPNSGDIAVLPISGGQGGAIADGSITTVDIANGAITSDKLAANLTLGGTVVNTTVSGQPSGNFVILQGSTPGTPQSGHINVSGTIIAGAFSGDGSNLTNISVSFADVLAGTNTGALVIGSGGSLTTSGSGSITATDLNCSSCVALGGETSGDYVASFTAGNGLTGDASGETSTPTLNIVSANGGIVAGANDIALTLTSSGTIGATASNSGLEISSGGLSLLKGCADTELLKWTDAGGWACAADISGGAGGATLQSAYDAPSGNTITTSNARNIAFTFADFATDQSLTLTQQGTAAALILDDTNGGTNTAIDIQSGGVSKLTITELGTVSTSGNISTTSSGTINSAGLLTASNGLTQTTGALNLTATSGAVDLALTSFAETYAGSGNAHTLTVNGITTGSALNISSSNAGAGLSSGKLINATRTQTSGGGALTGSIANLGFTATYTGGAGGNDTGNILNASRSVTMNFPGGTRSVSGALATLSDSATLTSGAVFNHTADVLDIAQNYTLNTGAALNVTTAGTGLALRVNDDGTLTDSTAFVVDAGGNVGVGTTAPASLLSVGTSSASNFKVNADGDLTTSFTQLNGTGDTNGAGALSTSLVLDAGEGANFDAGNYVRVDPVGATACSGSVTVCYAKIVSKATDTLTISPALSWNDNTVVDEFHVPEVGAINSASTLTNRYGRGYFIDGIVIGNSSTYYTEHAITSENPVFNLLNESVATLNIGGAATSLNLGPVGGTISILGNLAVNGGDITSSGALVVQAASGALTLDSTAEINIGNTNATSVSLCNSTACDTIQLGTNADADTIQIGDANDTLTLTGEISLTDGQWSISTLGVATGLTGTLTGLTVGIAQDLVCTDCIGGVEINESLLSVPFSSVASGTSLGALVVGTGGSLAVSGTGTITATDLVASSSVVSDPEVDDALTLNSITNAGNLAIDLTGVLTRTLTLQNSTVAQIANLDLSDGGLLTNGTTRIANDGTASFISGTTIGSQTFTTNNIADSGALTINSATTNALTLDSGTTGTVNLGIGNNAKTIAIGTGTAGNTINVGTNNTTLDTINIGSALDDVAITGDQWSVTNAGVLTVVSCSGCGGGGATLDSAYTAGNTIGTDSGSNVIINLAEVATPTELTINNLDTAGTNAVQIDNGIASGILTNGLLIEQSGAGALTNGVHVLGTAGAITDGIHIEDGAGTIADGIQFTGTFTNLINSTNFIVSSAGALTAVGVNSGAGLIQGTAGLTITGAAISLNASSNFDVNVATGTSTGDITLGGGTAGQLISINSDDWDISTTGAITGVGAITSDGAISTTSTLNADGATTLAALTLDAGSNFVMSSGAGTFAQTNAQTTDATSDAVTLTLSAGGTGETGALRGLVISQSDTGTTGVYDSLAYIENLKTPQTTTNGLYINHNAASGTLTNGLNITSTAGTITNAISITATGTITDAIDISGTPGGNILDTASLDITGAGAITGATGVATTTLSSTGATTLGNNSATVVIDGTNFDLSSAGVITLAGAQTKDITTASAGTSTALVIQPGDSTTASGTGSNLTLRGSNQTGTTSTGGNLVLQAGTGTSTNGIVQIGTANTSALTLGATGILTTNTGSLTVTQTLTANTLSSSGVTITGGTINSTSIGATTASTGKFTTLTSTGATDLANAGASNVSIATTGTGTVAIGNATGTFALSSSGGLNVTTGGALTGVASLDTIATSATALTFAGAGTVAATGANALTLNGGATGALTLTGNAASTWSTSSGLLTVTGTGGLTETSGAGTNIAINPGTTGDVIFTQGNDSAHAINSTTTTDLTLNIVDINSSNSAAASTNTLNLLAVRNLNEAGSATGTPDSLIYATNLDANETVTNGLFIEQATAGGTLSTGLQLTQSAGTFTTGINFTGTFTNYITAPNFNVTNAGAISAGSITSGFGTIDTGADNITTTGTVFGNTFDRSTAGLLSIGTGGAGNATSLTLGSASVTAMTFTTDNNAANDFTFTGGATFASNVVIQGTTGVTFNTGAGGDITFANLEKIDNDVNGAINLTATTLELTGGTTIHSDQTSVALLNTTATTINFGGGATTALNIGSTTTGSNIFNADVDMTFAGAENLNITNTTLNSSSDTASIAQTLTGDVNADGLSITITDNNASAVTGVNYGLNVVNADNAGNTSVIDSLALFSNDQATETLADGVIIRHNVGSGTLTDGLQIENTTAGGTITNAINILETAGTITTALNIGNNIGTGISIGTGVTTGISVGSGGITIVAGALAVNSDSITSDGATLTINAAGTVNVQDALDVDSTIQAGSSNVTLTLATGFIDADALTLIAAADAGTGTSSGSGLIARSDGIGLLQGCTDTQILKWVESTDTWDCSTDAGGGDLDVTYDADSDKILNIDNASGLTLALSSGTHDLTVSGLDADSNLILTGLAGNNAALYAVTGTGVVATATTSTAGLCLVSGASATFTPTWSSCAGGAPPTLQTAYDSDVDGGNATVALTTLDDSIIFQNPLASGTDSGFVFQIDQLATGNVDGIQISNAGTGDGIQINGTSTGNLANFQQSGVSRFTVSSKGALTINGSDTNIVRTTSAEFTAGLQITNLTSTNDQLELADGTVSGDGTITTAGQPTVDAAIGAGSSTIMRADGKYLIIKGGSALTTSLYDSLANTFTNSQTLVVGAGTVGVGSVALPRPNGMYVVILGNGVVNTSNVDPMGVVTSTAGGSLTAAAGAGTTAFRRNDGRFLVTLGGGAGTTNIFDPILNTFVAGPTNSGAVAWGIGALALARPNGDALFITGGAAATTQAYTASTGTITGSGPIGSFVAGTGAQVLPTGCEINNVGSVAIRKADGKYIVLSKINVSAVYDPITNTFSQNAGSCTTPTVGRGPTVALADGAHAVPLQDGRFLVIHGGALTSTSIYDPQTDLFTTGPTITAGGAGRHSIMAADGTWRLLAGGGTATNKYDTQLNMTGIYRSEDISTSSLNANSTLRWTRESELAFSGIGQGAGGPGVLTATQSAGGGSCTAGVHSYRVTFMINGVETYGGPASNAVTCVGGTDKVVLTNIPIGPVGTTTRNVYRIGDAAGFTSYKLVNGGSPTCVLGNNTTTTCTDTLADASLTTTVAGQSGAGAASTVQFFVRTAVNSSGCATPLDNALDKEITALNDFIRPASERDNCIRITVKFNRPIPRRVVDERERGTFTGNNTTAYRLDYATPALFDVTVDNSNVLRRSGITFNFPLPNSEFVGLAGAAPAALTAGAPSSGGSCTAGTHTWKYTYITGGQESLPSAVSAMQTCTGPNGTVALSGITTGPTGTTARKVYRTLANDTSQYYLLTTINDNSTTIFSDTLADSALTSPIPGLEPSGPVFSRAETTADKLYLPYGQLTPTSQVGTTGYYMGSTGVSSNAHPSLPQAQTNAGTMVIARPNKTFKIIAALTTPAANGAIYDPASEQFSALQAAPNIPTAANGAGGFALKRPDGKYLVVLGNATATTNIYDPVNDTFVAGPSIPAGVVANGGSAIPNTDGTFTIVQGATTVGGATASTTSAIYDPVRNTMTAGPTLTTGSNSGFFAIPLRNGMYKIGPGKDCAGTAVTATMNYDPRTKVFSAGTALTTTIPGCGAYVFQRADGWWEIVAGESVNAGQLTTNIINPDNGASSIGAPMTTNLNGEGGLMIPRPDGTFLALNGNGLSTSNVIIPFGVGPAASAASGVSQLGVAPVGPVLHAVTGPGSVAFQRPDGKFVVINGNAAATTQLIDAGWYPDGQYLSEQMQVPALAANSTLEWKQGPDSYIKMEVRAASSQAALTRTAFTSVGKPGQSFYNAGGETWVQVEVNMRREFPTWSGNLDGTYNSGGGMVFPYRNIPVPTLFSYQINNGMDLLSLQSGGSNVFRVTSNGGIYSSLTGGFFSGGADLAENYSSSQMLEAGEVVMIDGVNTAGVVRSTGQYQRNILGVVSTNPGFVAGAHTEDSYPIALVGRVPVKISTENGPVRVGDFLTSSSIPGYAMKATQAGRVIGKALESFYPGEDKACPAFGLGNLPTTKCGTITMFVNLTDYLGQPIEVAMAEAAMLPNESQVDEEPASTTGGFTIGPKGENAKNQELILAFLRDLKAEKASSGISSEIFTDRIMAASEIISPNVVTDTLRAKEIYAEKIKANQIEGLEILTNKISNLQSLLDNQKPPDPAGPSPDLAAQDPTMDSHDTALPVEFGKIKIDSAKISLDLTVGGALVVSGGLTVDGPAQFNGEVAFKSISNFFGKVTFGDEVAFGTHVIFSPDSGGGAVIKKGDSKVTIKFSLPYTDPPIVSANYKFENTLLPDDTTDTVINKYQRLLDGGISYTVGNIKADSFNIYLNKPATEDINFQWLATPIKDAKISVSESQ